MCRRKAVAWIPEKRLAIHLRSCQNHPRWTAVRFVTPTVQNGMLPAPIEDSHLKMAMSPNPLKLMRSIRLSDSNHSTTLLGVLLSRSSSSQFLCQDLHDRKDVAPAIEVEYFDAGPDLDQVRWATSLDINPCEPVPSITACRLRLTLSLHCQNPDLHEWAKTRGVAPSSVLHGHSDMRERIFLSFIRTKSSSGLCRACLDLSQVRYVHLKCILKTVLS